MYFFLGRRASISGDLLVLSDFYWPRANGPVLVSIPVDQLKRKNPTSGFNFMHFNPFKSEFTNVIFIHYKPRIAVAILGLQWMKMIWCGLKKNENCLDLINQFYGNFRSKTVVCRKNMSVFRDVRWCFNASWGLKGLIFQHVQIYIKRSGFPQQVKSDGHLKRCRFFAYNLYQKVYIFHLF